MRLGKTGRRWPSDGSGVNGGPTGVQPDSLAGAGLFNDRGPAPAAGHTCAHLLGLRAATLQSARARLYASTVSAQAPAGVVVTTTESVLPCTVETARSYMAGAVHTCLARRQTAALRRKEDAWAARHLAGLISGHLARRQVVLDLSFFFFI